MWCTHDTCDAWVLKLRNTICKQVDYKTCVYIKENELQNTNIIEQVYYIAWIGGLIFNEYTYEIWPSEPLHMGRKAIRHVMLKQVGYEAFKTYRGGCMINYPAVPTQYEKLTCGK